jgi:hypothetical protein
MTGGAHGEGNFWGEGKGRRLGHFGPKWSAGGGAGPAGVAHGGGRKGEGGAAGPGARGGCGWAKNGEGGGERRKRFSFFSKVYFPLDECIQIVKRSKGMYGSAWCITQNKVF